MGYTVSTDPQITVVNLLKDNWDNSNTTDASTDPAINTGWWNEPPDDFQVGVTNKDESAQGDTGYSGIDPTGSGPIKEMDGLLLTTCWVKYDTDAFTNPKRLRFEMGEEVQRIIGNNTTGKDSIDRYISVDGPQETVLQDTSPTVLGHQFTITYGYQRTP